MNRFACASSLLLLVLSACGTLEITVDRTPTPDLGATATVGALQAQNAKLATQIATLKPGSTPLTPDSTSEQIQRAMLESATQWKTIWMDGVSTSYAPEGVNQPSVRIHEEVWIDLATNRFRILTGPNGGTADRFLASDGGTILEMDLKSGQSQVRSLPQFPKGPFVPNFRPGFADPQPLWGQIGTQLSELAFASDFAQNEGRFKPIAMEDVAGRKTLVVEWTYVKNTLPSWRAWLDAETAVILKMQNFDKGGGTAVREEEVLNQVVYNADFTDAMFRAPASLPQFSDINGNFLTPAAPAPTPSSQADPLGQVYFFIFDHNYGHEVTRLVRLPGSCVTRKTTCPEPEEIPTPLPFNFSLTPLVWSPDGRVAAYAYPGNKNGDRTKLSLFDPAKQTWTSLTEFNVIDPPMWSPDGKWLGFRVQDGQGGEDIYAIRQDGTGLTKLPAEDKLPSVHRPYRLEGWTTDGAILRSSEGKAYLMNPADGTVKPFLETMPVGTQFIPSPDGTHLAYVEYSQDSPKRVLKLSDIDGGAAHDLAAFQGGSIYPIVWSSDGNQLAFVRYVDPVQADQELYVVHRDGGGLSQVYHSMAIDTVAFSPDGAYLMLQDHQAAGQHIFIVNLASLEQHMIQAPNLPLDWWWRAPSWQP